VRAAERGEPLDPRLGKHAGLRSLHNNYLTLPVVYIMIGNHFPFTYGHPANWAILAGLFLASVGVRHYLNLHERGRDAIWLLPLATAAILVLAYVTAPPSVGAADPGAPQVAFAEVERIVVERCATCHAAEPSDEVFTSAPAGVMLDTPERIIESAERIYQNAVATSYMPLGNKTGITDEERATLGTWFEQGARP
jgi:uncharacterized membrane protein